jgi:hypothetical protein
MMAPTPARLNKMTDTAAPHMTGCSFGLVDVSMMMISDDW